MRDPYPMTLSHARSNDVTTDPPCPIAGKEPVSGLPSRPQHEVVLDPARLEWAAILADCGLGLALTG